MIFGIDRCLTINIITSSSVSLQTAIVAVFFISLSAKTYTTGCVLYSKKTIYWFYFGDKHLMNIELCYI